MKTKIRWATGSEISSLNLCGRMTWRVIALEIDEKAEAFLALSMSCKDLPAFGWGEITDSARATPKALHNFGIASLYVARSLGVSQLYLLADKTVDKSDNWARHLGFVRESNTAQGDFYKCNLRKLKTSQRYSSLLDRLLAA